MKINRSGLLILFIFCIACRVHASAETNAQILERIWKIGSEKFCAKDKQSYFSKDAFNEILSKTKSQDNRDDLAKALNPFLFSLGWSHTEFMTGSSESYYFFKSHEAMTNPKSAPAPLFVTPGIQVGKDEKGFFVKEILDGFPAQAAGLKKMDRIVSFNRNIFDGSWGKESASGVVQIERNGVQQDISLTTKAVNWSESFQQATAESARIFHQTGGKKIGYVHLWSGVHPQSAALLQKIVTSFKKDKVNGVILDLRGGYGGAWWDHLDPFFADTSSYMQMEAQMPDGRSETLKSPFKKNKKSYSGPMVVLINQGVRSGKEALAYQFKKTKRAHLIGEKTPGYFSTGQYFFANEPKDYILYVCVFKIQLDGVQIEGVGIQPDEVVSFSPEGEFGDSQLAAGLNFFK